MNPRARTEVDPLENRLRPHFQPILDLGTMSVHGFEGLIRGSSDTVLHSPIHLLQCGAPGHLLRLDLACIRTSWWPSSRAP